MFFRIGCILYCVYTLLFTDYFIFWALINYFVVIVRTLIFLKLECDSLFGFVALIDETIIYKQLITVADPNMHYTSPL